MGAVAPAFFSFVGAADTAEVVFLDVPLLYGKDDPALLARRGGEAARWCRLQYEISQVWMFFGVARFAQYFNIFWVCPSFFMGCVSKFVMALKIIFGATFFTLANKFEFFGDGRFGCVGSRRRTVIPKWMRRSSHIPATRLRHARDRAIFSSAAAALSCLEFSATFLTGVRKHYLGALWPQDARTRSRASGSFTRNLRVWAVECPSTIRTNMFGCPALFQQARRGFAGVICSSTRNSCTHPGAKFGGGFEAVGWPEIKPAPLAFVNFIHTAIMLETAACFQ